MKIIRPLSYSFSDYPDNFSSNILLYIIGCHGECIGCHNPSLFNGSQYMDINTNVDELLSLILHIRERGVTNKLVIQGGEPLMKDNIPIIRELIEVLKNNGVDICLYTGYDINYVRNHNIKGYEYIKCGRYDKNLAVTPMKTDVYMQLASTNQIMYDKNNKQISKNGCIRFR